MKIEAIVWYHFLRYTSPNQYIMQKFLQKFTDCMASSLPHFPNPYQFFFFYQFFLNAALSLDFQI